MSFMNASDFEALSNLLSSGGKPEDDDDPFKDTGMIGRKPDVKPDAITPADIGEKSAGKPAAPQPKKKDPYAVWDEDEEIEMCAESNLPRPPSLVVTLRHVVTAGTVFLGIDGKENSAADADEAVVKIHLPGEILSGIDAQVEDTHLVLRSKQYYAVEYFPRKVKGKEAKATWDKDKELLTVVVPFRADDI